MKAFAVLTILSITTLTACSKNEQPQSTAPADYAETEKKLIQNRENDSLMGDSINASKAMPPQPSADRNQNQSELKP